MKLKALIKGMIEKGELDWLLKILIALSACGDNSIERVSKSLIHLLNDARNDSIDK